MDATQTSEAAQALLDDARVAALTECVRESCISTFAMMAGTAPTASAGIPDDPADMICVISFVGNHEPWSLVFGLPRTTAVTMAPRFAGFEIEFESADMADAVGEMLNIIAGDLVARLEECGLQAQMSVPSISRGVGVELMLPDSRELLSIHFDCDDGPFWVRVAARRQPSAGRAGCCPHCGR